MTTQVDFQLIPLSTSPYPATSPSVFATTSDQTNAVITTAGACADLVTAGVLKVRDIIFANYDVDGTPAQATYTVTSTSGGSLVAYTIPAGYLAAANNLSDVLSASTARTNLGAQAQANIIAGQLSNGGGGTTVTLTNASITSSSVIVATVAASTNASYVVKVVPGSGSAVITLSADPGASTKISYVIFVAAQ